MSKNNKNCKDNRVKIIVLGDNEKTNEEFINAYSKNCIKTKGDGDSLCSFSKRITEHSYVIELFTVTSPIERMIVTTQLSLCVIIAFDMTERESFDNLLDKWLIWLRDTCKYEGKIIVVGYKPSSDDDVEEYLITSEDEVQEAIKCAEVNAVFKQLTNSKAEEEMNELDRIIFESMNSMDSHSANEESNHGSMKNGGCLVV